MTDLEKALLFIDCNKCLEEYMVKFELEGKSPRFWLLDRFWRMKRLYEAGPCLMKLIGLKRSERVKTFAFNVSFAITILSFWIVYIVAGNTSIFSTIILGFISAWSIISILASFVTVDYELTTNQLALAEELKTRKFM